MDDGYRIGGWIAKDSIYGANPSGLKGFRRFLRIAIRQPGLLPSWWTAENVEACEEMGKAGGDGRHQLSQILKPDNVRDLYGGNPMASIQLRLFADQVDDGTLVPRDQSGTDLLMGLLLELEHNTISTNQQHIVESCE